MAIRQVQVSEDVGNARSVALLPALRDPSIAGYLLAEEAALLQGYGGRYHHELKHEDALWMAQTLLRVVQVSAPGTREVQLEDGVTPGAA